MNHTSSLVFAGIAPHPPIMVPEVGGESCVEVQNSISAMAEVTERIIKSGAETVVLISPHAPLEAVAFVAYDGPTLYGDFSMFRAPDATVEAKLDDELLTEITRAAEQYNLITLRIRDADLDHGTAVPLYFLQRNGWSGKVVALGYSFLSNEDHLRFGNCIRQAIATVKRPVAFIASGDLSHRLKPGAPAGYNSEAHLFDEEVVDAIRSCQTNRIVNIDQDLRRVAGECGYRSMLVALGVIEGIETSCEVLSYEGPFGVGYLVAQLVSLTPKASDKVARGKRPQVAPPLDHRNFISSEPAKRATDDSSDSAAPDQPPATAGGSDSFPNLARRTVETFIRDGTIINAPGPLATASDSDNTTDLLAARAGCFVSIKTHDGDLRGCIVTIDPVKDTLAEEIITNAISAATRDPRFPPVRTDELPNLKYSVDVLSASEPCTLDDLDPKIYGVIVEDESGVRRGLLLPNLEGINTSAQQVEIAVRKAGIASGTPIKLFRFRADRYSE
jgi:AmmeMemoRadiSam system protein A/AmmeMemoRadiSam system protein B